MTQCQFIYVRKYAGRAAGTRCSNTGISMDTPFCRAHRDKVPERVDEGRMSTFPRIFSEEEERMWVNEARRRTDPILNIMRACVVCGQLCRQEEITLLTENDIIGQREFLTATRVYSDVPSTYFHYGSLYPSLNGLILDPNGFLKEAKSEAGHVFIARICRVCHQSFQNEKIPSLALANSLWTGVGCVKELKDLNWVEEKMISLIHVSCQVQKCRMVKHWGIDQFYPQSRIKGHIFTYPMDPTLILNRLPISAKHLCGLVKVVFMGVKQSILSDLSRFQFFLVRRQIVLDALQFLIRYNPLYRGVELDYTVLSELPENGIPSEIQDCITFCNRMKEDMMGHSRYDESDDESGEILY
jgi:hypothetical protein